MNARAISQVIGVILIFAFTVILAVVFAAFVYVMFIQFTNQGPQNPGMRVLTADENTVRITFISAEGSTIARFTSNDSVYTGFKEKWQSAQSSFGPSLSIFHCYNSTGLYEVECPAVAP
jgi:flagellin-like protein